MTRLRGWAPRGQRLVDKVVTPIRRKKRLIIEVSALTLARPKGDRGQKLGHFRFDRLGQKRPRAIAQNLGQPVGQIPG